MTELQQTKGSVRFEGIVVGFDPTNENTYREGETKAGKDYRNVNLAIKTSENNILYASLFGQISDKKVKVFSNKNGEKKSLEIDFEDRHNVPEGFTCLGFGTAAVALEYANGKPKRKNYFAYDAVENIVKNLNDGDSVWVDAEFNIDEFISNGETKTSVKYTIRGIGALKNPIDFQQENFKEISSFEQEIVVTGNNVDKESKRLYVSGRTIEYNKQFHDMTFVVDMEKYQTLASNIYKKTKFGDVLHVEGRVINGVVLVEAPEDEEINWGGETPEGQGRRMIRNKVSELQITNVKKHTGKVYKEEDFVQEIPGVLTSGSGYDPFADDGKPIDISEEDLPF